MSWPSSTSAPTRTPPGSSRSCCQGVDDFSSELIKNQPQDLTKKIGEFDQDLSDYRDKRELTTAGYDELSAHLNDLRGTL